MALPFFAFKGENKLWDDFFDDYGGLDWEGLDNYWRAQ